PTLFRSRAEGALTGKSPEKVLARLRMRLRGRTTVVIEAHSEALEALGDHRMVPVDDLLWAYALGLCLQEDGHAVLVRAADIHDVASLQALVPDVQIGRQIRSGHMSKMDGAVSIGKCRCDQDTFEGFLRHSGARLLSGGDVVAITWLPRFRP